MRKKVRSRLVRTPRGAPGAGCYRSGTPLTDEQFRNLRFRSDAFGPDGRTLVFVDEAERALAWREHRMRFIGLSNLGSRCSAFWQLEPDLPAELRDLSPVTGYGSVESAVAAHGRIAAARWRWLLEHPEHHRDGEREVLQQLVAPPAPLRGK